ncbi:DUF1127 domain-containing protein [Mesorhizobium sp. M9A.F.Ca.ET.002.03.1.2]|uniref:DUF1127 domain-containing protein n=1 Tax=Mesorhizobium sp. M9A.F.Ca.ET.002.03.1.2 TaxID=2493668 RepID=UPI000F75F2E9|nr:DUF1127 domain-containing protein [Mesorhizobium sp. M9A.F.Ca.ET.002.03.1.2]AZN98813.1 DUF1127 domain-containing protein [Mesorhizobium sp. M9A.F.Ca.ET.002.03.1.2]
MSEIFLSAALRRFIRVRRDRQHLYELPDYILRDIGIDRSEINSITLFAGADSSRRSRF